MLAKLDRPDVDSNRSCERIKAQLDDLISQVREDTVKANDPQARALFEMTAEVLIGLKTAYIHYEAGIEPGFQSESAAQAPDGTSEKASARTQPVFDPASLGES